VIILDAGISDRLGRASSSANKHIKRTFLSYEQVSSTQQSHGRDVRNKPGSFASRSCQCA
jgi:hypothetical protein